MRSILVLKDTKQELKDQILKLIGQILGPKVV